MRGFVLAAGLLLAGCTLSTTVLPRPPEGYAALRFLRSVSFDVPGGYIEIPAGAVLVGDKIREGDGQPLFCGQLVYRSLGLSETKYSCIARNGDKVSVGAELANKGYGRDLPPGAVEEIRV